jgi:aminopeptidase-like protein
MTSATPPSICAIRSPVERSVHTLRLSEATHEAGIHLGNEMMALMRDLFPMTRSITGPGLRATVQRLSQTIPLRVTELASGTRAFDWIIPEEWSIDDGYIEHESGRRFANFRESNLHIVNYSTPVDTVLSLDELRPHLHSLPDHPDWVPYRNSYYSPSWGFCLSDRVLRTLPDGRYRAVIRSQLKPGSLTLAEYVHTGTTEEEVLIFAHDCHPSLANDNLSGVVVATFLAKYLDAVPTRYTYRFVFAPATIGSIAWLATNKTTLPRIRHGLVLALLGNAAPLFYKQTRNGKCAIDRAAAHILGRDYPGAEVLEFSPWGYDERQFGSPGINLPIGGLSRSPDATLPENHTSADHPDAISPAALSEAWLACLKIFEALENDVRYVNLQPNGEPQLGRRGLYRSTGGYYASVSERQMALLWMLNQSDGTKSVLDVAERSGISIGALASAASELEAAGLFARPPASPLRD